MLTLRERMHTAGSKDLFYETRPTRLQPYTEPPEQSPQLFTALVIRLVFRFATK
jgi:hypothetical protein